MWVVEKRETEITSLKAARACYEGITLDLKANKRDISPKMFRIFHSKKEAMEYLNRQENYYFYNGSGYGKAIEWTGYENNDENPEAIEYYDAPRSNFSEFKKSLE